MTLNPIPYYTFLRSQAIYGSSVETLGPYPQYYTMVNLLYFKHFFILLYQHNNSQQKKRTFYMSAFLLFVFIVF